MDIAGFISGINTTDLVLVLYFMGFFVLGFAQGTIRRLIGIASILFSFFFAANVAAPLSEFLGANWTQFSKEYSYMIGFLTVFVAASVAFAIVIQGFYKPQPLFEKARFADELIGGILGLIQAGIILACFVIILDSFFRIPTIAQDPQEIEFLREFWKWLNVSQIVDFFRTAIIPIVLSITSFLVPDSIESMYPVGG